MGLDTSHNCWHGSYSSFNSFRIKLAKEIGIELYEMEGFTSNGKPWSEVDHGIVPLLFHSDCDGVLTVEECKRIAEGLTQIIDKLPDPEEHDVHENYYGLKGRAIKFRDGCLLAIKKKEQVEFH